MTSVATVEECMTFGHVSDLAKKKLANKISRTFCEKMFLNLR